MIDFWLFFVIRRVDVWITNHFVIFPFPICYDKLERKYFLIVHFYLPHRGAIASSVRNKSMYTEEHFVGFKAMNGFWIEKDVYLVWFYAIFRLFFVCSCVCLCSLFSSLLLSNRLFPCRILKIEHWQGLCYHFEFYYIPIHHTHFHALFSWNKYRMDMTPHY